MSVDLVASSEIIPSWINAPGISYRADVTNLSDVVAEHPVGTVSLIVEGYTQVLDLPTWDVVANCTPFDPWQVFVLDEDRLDTAGSELAAGIDADDLTMSVATTSGPLWTTDPDDMPFDVDVAGDKITVTAISGSSSPQTFTITRADTAAAHDPGDAVSLWRPAVLAL
jgi:hypothetical protein